MSVGSPVHDAGQVNVPVRVQRTPFYLESEKQSLFAWIHRIKSAEHSQHGVVICPPMGHEQVHGHRGLRHLADALAEAGFPTLRLDLHGTGDSAGDLEEPNRRATWLANLRSAASWLQTELGCTRITFVGIRLGAALATEIAAESELAGLVLWAPIVKGRAYVRELKALALAAGAPTDTSKDIESAGFVITEANASDLSDIDLLQTRPKCRRTLIVDRDDMPPSAKLLEHFRSLGIDARQTVQPGYAGLMAEPHLTEVPSQAIGEIVAWMRADVPEDREAPIPRENSWPSEAVVAPLGNGLLREKAVTICTEPELFGILSGPSTCCDGKSELPVVMLLNAGSAHRIGPNRLHVLLARRLAARGFCCLRMDLNGLGDSIQPNAARENNPYPETAFRDIDLALRFAGRELAANRVILMGLCSGAYDAFQAAVQFPSVQPEIVESVVINPLTFYWHAGMTVESAQTIKFQAFRESMTSAQQLGKWLKLLTGRSKLGIKGAFRVLLERWQLGRQISKRTWPNEHSVNPAVMPSHPKINDLSGDLARIIRNKRSLSFYFARSDPGYDILKFYARRPVEEMTQAGQMRLHFIENADHTFSQKVARETLIREIVDDLWRRFATSPIR